MKRNEISGECRTHRRGGEWIQNFCGKYRNGRDDSNVDGKAVLRWILHKQDVKAWSVFVWPRLETSGGFINHGYVPVDFIKIPRISWSVERLFSNRWIHVSLHLAHFTLLISCIFLQPIYQPTNALNKIQFMTSMKLLHVSAQGCHLQGFF
jgi:hypothetical protein